MILQKLDERQKMQIIKRYVCGEKIYDLANTYGVTYSCINHLLKHRHVPIRPGYI